MSHEIRTPMSGVIGVLDLMNRSRLHDEDRHLLDMARGAAGTLLRILNDVLDFSKSQSGKLTIESQPFSLRTVIDEVTGLFEPEIRHRGLHFDAFVSELVAPGLIGDGQRLAQVLFNLVGNALKFTDQGGIGVAVDAQPVDPVTQAQGLSITVRDTGIGIDEAEQARLFEPFVQAGTRHQGGTGLGLAICKRLIHAMGGTISLRSAVGKGTSVEITLALPVDVHAMPAQAQAKTQQDDGALAKAATPVAAGVAPLAFTIPDKSILVVEDQAINRELLLRQCQALGIQSLDVAVDGLEAWHAYEKHAYTLVITDCAMPRMDGEALIRRIRADEKNGRGSAYLVALTANAMDSQRQACLDAGANEVLVKPVNLDQLRTVLASAFGSTPPAVSAATAPSWLPESIPADEWPQLRERIVVDMGREFSAAREAVAGSNWKRAYDAVHRILGVAKWFGLSDIASLSAAIQAALDEQRTEDVVLEPLEEAIAALAREGQAS
jgi:CheY-like chemotaxis protein